MQKYWLGQVLTSVFPTTYDLEPLAVFFPDIFVSIVLPCVFNGQTMNIQNVQRAIPTLIVVDCCVHRSTPRIYLVVCFCSPHSYEILMTDKCFAAIYFLETTRAWKFVTINFLHDYLFSKVFHSNKRQVVCKDNLLSFSYKKKKKPFMPEVLSRKLQRTEFFLSLEQWRAKKEENMATKS
jgi:hypothetical protein